MSNEPNKPIPAQELTDKELEGINGGGGGGAVCADGWVDICAGVGAGVGAGV